MAHVLQLASAACRCEACCKDSSAGCSAAGSSPAAGRCVERGGLTIFPGRCLQMRQNVPKCPGFEDSAGGRHYCLQCCITAGFANHGSQPHPAGSSSGCLLLLAVPVGLLGILLLLFQTATMCNTLSCHPVRPGPLHNRRSHQAQDQGSREERQAERKEAGRAGGARGSRRQQQRRRRRGGGGSAEAEPRWRRRGCSTCCSACSGGTCRSGGASQCGEADPQPQEEDAAGGGAG